MSSADSDTSVLGALKDIATGALDRSTAVNPEICAAVDTDSEGTNLDREGLVGATTRSVTGGLSDLKGAAVPTPEDRGDQLGQQKFRRREFVAGIGTATAAGLAGCGGSSNEERGSENGDVTEASDTDAGTSTESEDDIGEVETVEEQPDRENTDAQGPAGSDEWAYVAYDDVGENPRIIVRITDDVILENVGEAFVYTGGVQRERDDNSEQALPIDDRARMFIMQNIGGDDQFLAVATAGTDSAVQNIAPGELLSQTGLDDEEGVLVLGGELEGVGSGVVHFDEDGDSLQFKYNSVNPGSIANLGNEEVEYTPTSEIVASLSEEDQQDVSGVAVES